MPQQGQDYSADAISSAPFLPLPPVTPAPESRPPVVPVVARLPHLGETERPSILPIRHDPHCLIEATESADGIECIKGAKWNISSRLWERSRWLRERLVHDRLLLGSWICIAILGGITVSDFVGENFLSPRPQKNSSDDATLVLHETPWTEETAITHEERPSNPFAAVTIDDDKTKNAPTDGIEQSWANTATPWDKPVTSAYSPWNVASVNPTTEEVATDALPATTPSATTGLLSKDVYRVAAYEPTGFSGYDPVAPFTAVHAEREVPMRPATPIVSPVQPVYAASYAPMPIPAPNGMIPVAESRQTFRRDVTPPPAQAGSGYPRW